MLVKNYLQGYNINVLFCAVRYFVSLLRFGMRRNGPAYTLGVGLHCPGEKKENAAL